MASPSQLDISAQSLAFALAQAKADYNRSGIFQRSHDGPAEDVLAARLAHESLLPFASIRDGLTPYKCEVDKETGETVVDLPLAAHSKTKGFYACQQHCAERVNKVNSRLRAKLLAKGKQPNDVFKSVK